MTRVRIIAAVIGVAGIFGAGWVVNGWRLSGQHAQELAKRDSDALTVAEAVKQAGIVANNAISDADQRAWKGLEDDKKELGRLRGCVADRTCGVRLITKYVSADNGAGDSSTSSVGHDTVEIDPDVQRRVLDHGEAIREDAAKLSFLQAYARECFKATSGDSAASYTQSWLKELMAKPLMEASAGLHGR